MNNFAKAAVAAVLLAGAGAANASVNYTQDGLNEAYLSAYDNTTGLTFTFDTGVTFNELLANINNASYALNFNFAASAEHAANWNGFIANAAFDKIKWVVAVASANDFAAMFTSNQAVVDPVGENGVFNAGASIAAHAVDLNAKLANGINPAINESSLVSDAEPAGSGQHANGNLLWGGYIDVVEANWGEAIAFQYGVVDIDENSPTFFQTLTTTFAQKWTLNQDGLSFAPAAVPLPGAVWMFGAGLLGLLGVNRRKAA